MYFAFENLAGTALADLVENVSAQLASASKASLHAYALVDCAFDESLITKPGLRKLRRAYLYEGTRLSAFDAASPFLLRLPDDRSAQAQLIALLAALCGRRPMWSLIVADLDLMALASHFRPFLLGRCTDGLAWPIRWADVRVLPALLNLISENYSRYLLTPFHTWLLSTRRGTVQTVAGSAAPRPVLHYVETNVTDSQFSLLLENSEPDTVIAKILEIQTNLLAGHVPCEAHELVLSQLKRASQIGIFAAPQRLHFSTLALLLKTGFETHPEFLSLIENMAKGARYYDEMGKISAEFWQATSISNG